MPLFARLQQTLFRHRSDGLAPLRLNQRRVFILPTRGGLLFTLALGVMLITAINYNLALGHALVFLLAGLGITGMLHTFRNLFGLVIAPGACKPVFAGEMAHFPLRLTNASKSARLALRFEAETLSPQPFSLPGHSTGEVALPFLSEQRGWFLLPRIKLSSIYPLGLFIAWSYLHPEMRCLIYPKPIKTPLPPENDSEHQGMHRGESGQEDFAGFRDRQPADSLRHVAWKACARDTQDRPLLLKQFSGGRERKRVLDWASTATNAPVEYKISQLTGWVLTAESEQMAYALRLPGTETALSHGEMHMHDCLQRLALFTP